MAPGGGLSDAFGAAPLPRVGAMRHLGFWPSSALDSWTPASLALGRSARCPMEVLELQLQVPKHRHRLPHDTRAIANAFLLGNCSPTCSSSVRFRSNSAFLANASAATTCRPRWPSTAARSTSFTDTFSFRDEEVLCGNLLGLRDANKLGYVPSEVVLHKHSVAVKAPEQPEVDPDIAAAAAATSENEKQVEELETGRVPEGEIKTLETAVKRPAGPTGSGRNAMPGIDDRGAPDVPPPVIPRVEPAPDPNGPRSPRLG